MADSLKVLGQVAPDATTNTTLYLCPSLTMTTTSSLIICNRSASGVTYRVAVRDNGDNTSNEHYIFYDVSLAANSSDVHVLGMTLKETDIVEVYASTADLSFTLFGVEPS